MPRGKKTEDLTTIQMALVGFQLEKQKIEDKIRELQGRLKGTHSAAPAAARKKAAPAGKRVLSAAARRRISKAQKKRWAAHRKAQKAGKA
ncbi:MAG TPA: hypothetical protein VE959_16825 [Bryobacteraceae bacterium]|nr:hypothetical protein [Bryobacteraceae bacterium]